MLILVLSNGVLGFESERGCVNPTGFESEQVAVIDHYARHGDHYERRTTAYPGCVAGLFSGTVAMNFTVCAPWIAAWEN